MTQRLQAIARRVPPCDTLYDIGTDHGHLPAHLVRKGVCRAAVATDISAPSLAKAQSLFVRLRLQGRTRCHLGDGLQGLAPQEGDCVTLCGMGARAMVKLLPPKLPCPLVLSTHVEPEHVRIGLHSLGYRIAGEELVRENGRYYVIWLVRWGEEEKPYDDAEHYMGRLLKNDALFGDYLAWRKDVAQVALQGGEARWRERLQWVEAAQAWRE